MPVLLAGGALLLLIPANVSPPGEEQDDVLAQLCRSYVLTSAVGVGLACLGSPPFRWLGAPRAATVLTSLWALAVTSAGASHRLSSMLVGKEFQF